MNVHSQVRQTTVSKLTNMSCAGGGHENISSAYPPVLGQCGA